MTRIRVTLALVTAVAVLVACAPDSTDETPPASEEAAPEPGPPAEETEELPAEEPEELAAEPDELVAEPDAEEPAPIPLDHEGEPTELPAADEIEITELTGDLQRLEPPVAAEDPEGLADQLLEIDAVIHDPDADPAAVAAAGHLHQVVSRALARRDDDTKEAVLARLDERAAALVRGPVASGRDLGAMHGAVERLPAAWEIVPPEPAERLEEIYRAAEAEYGVPWAYLAAINLVETRMGRIIGLSSAGAQGPMQFMPPTWDAFGGGGDVWDTRDAIFGAARYLAHSGAPDRMDDAIFAYNRDTRYVRAVQGYAQAMLDEPATHRAFHNWQVYVRTVDGDVWLPVGWRSPELDETG